MAEDFAARVKRLKYRSKHRGTKELDILLGRFAEQHLDHMTPAEIERYEAILEANEHDIYHWLAGKRPVPPEHDNAVMRRILSFEIAKSEP